jgi:non-ribosomal peptide synthetase component F
MLTPQNNILTLFEAQVRTTPTAVALLWGELRYTYAEVNARANQVARVLQAHGVTRETLVGICMPRSAEAVFAVLGAIKAGGAYVPIDPDYPVQRQIYMIEDAGLRVLLTDTLSTTAALPARLMIQLLAMDDACLPQQPTTNLNVPVAETSLLYVHYTSGSTGRPKGVCGTHQQLRHRLQWLWQAYPMTEHEVCCHKTTLQFVDASLEIFGTLLAGRPLVIVSTEQASNPEVLLQVLAERQVTRLFLVVSHLRTLLLAQPALGDWLPALKLWVVSGEPLTRASLSDSRWLRPMPT